MISGTALLRNMGYMCLIDWEVRIRLHWHIRSWFFGVRIWI